LTKGTPHVFRTPHLPEAAPDLDVTISDLLVAATAAPTYFHHKCIKQQAFVDGGLWASGPSLLAYAEAMRIRNECVRGDCDPKFAVENISLLSIGTGVSQFSLEPPGSDAGLLYWARHAAEVMGAAQVQGIHQPLRFIMGNNYTHLNFEMTEKMPLDGVDNIPRFFEFGRERAEEEFEMLNGCFFGHQRSQYVPYEAVDGNVEIPTAYNDENT